MSSTAPITGRLETAGGGDSTNVIGQAFAARGLSVAGSPKAASATSFLLQQQCTSGFFRLDLNADKTAAQQGCVEGQAGSGPDVDVTALTVLQLSAIPTKSAAVTAAIGKAVTWLKANQRSDGSFGNSADITDSNSNSTGLVGLGAGEPG